MMRKIVSRLNKLKCKKKDFQKPEVLFCYSGSFNKFNHRKFSATYLLDLITACARVKPCGLPYEFCNAKLANQTIY